MRTTKARSAILSFLDREHTPVDVPQILSHLRTKQLQTNLVTIYRVLDAFQKEGLVKRIEFGEGKFRYEVYTEDHHHLVCQECGSVEDISDCDIPKLEEEIKKKKGFLVKRHALEFFGLCMNCQR